MTTQTADLSNLSLSEDWDAASAGSVPFPRDASQEPTDSPASDTTHGAAAEGKTRTISQLLRLYAEKGTDVSMSQDEANAVAEALGNWINSSPSPYEETRDDIAIRRPSAIDVHGRPRGQSDSVTQRLTNAAS